MSRSATHDLPSSLYPLSAGVFATSAYGLSKLLYHAEFADLPLEVVVQLQRMTTKLVDKGRAPNSTSRSPLPGIPTPLLHGSPPSGGFGCLPWQNHVRSRPAMWGIRLFRGLAWGLDDRSPPWLIVAHALILTMLPHTKAATPPALAFLHACHPSSNFSVCFHRWDDQPTPWPFAPYGSGSRHPLHGGWSY